ncbi:MAG: hypothetical protein AABW84_01140 [Nanoarchaeota archaeon]
MTKTTKTQNFRFDEEESNLTVTKIADGKVHVSFDAIADNGDAEPKEFVWKSEGDKVLVKTEEGKLKVTSKDEALNQAAKFLEAQGSVGRELLHTQYNLTTAKRSTEKAQEKIRATEKSKDNWQAGVVVTAAMGLIGAVAGVALVTSKDSQIAGLEDKVDQQNDTINNRNTIISDLAGDLAGKNATIKWHQDEWTFANKTIVDSGLYQAGWNDSVEARKNITREYITSNFNNDEIAAVTTENLNGLTIDQLFDVALKLEHNEGDAEGYQKAVDMVGNVLAAEGLNSEDYANSGLIERLVSYGEHVVSENKTAFFDDGYDEGYAIALQEAVSVADDILGKTKAGQYDQVDALVKAYGEAVAAEALELSDYTDNYVLSAVDSGNWSKADQALDRLANLRGGAPTIQSDNATKYQAFMTNISDAEKSELDKTALSFGYSGFTDMWNQGFGFYAVDTFGPGAVIVAYDSDTRMVGKLSDPLYNKIKSQGE